MDRGIVITIRVSIERPHAIRFESPLTPGELRKFILYHDRLCGPSVNGMSPQSEVDNKEYDLLASEGIIERPFIEISDHELERVGCGGEAGFHIGRGEAVSMIGVSLSDAEASRDGPLRNGPRSHHPVVEYTERGFGIFGYSPEQVAACQQLAQLRLVAGKNAEDGNCVWSVGQLGSGLDLQRAAPNHHDALVLSIMNALPVPTATQKLSKILDFKRKRRAELLALRQAVDGIAKECASDGNNDRAIKGGKEKVEAALLDIERVMKESALERTLGSLRTYLNLGAGALPTIVAANSGLGVAEALAIGYASNAILQLFRKKTSRVDGLSTDSAAFAFVYDVQRKLK